MALTVALAVLAAPAAAITPGQTDISDFTDPSSDWYGLTTAWDSVHETRAGSSVALGRWHMLSARHYYLGPGRTFYIGGDLFEVASIHTPPADDGQSSPPDMELLTVRNLSSPGTPLPAYVEPHATPLTAGQEMALIGTGYSGDDRKLGSTHFFTEDQGTGREKRWGTGEYNYTTRTSFQSWNTETLVHDFHDSTTEYEAGVAEGDSGAGAFVNVDGQWKLAGTVLYRYKPFSSGHRQVRLASVAAYADWMSQWVAEPGGGDANLDGTVDVGDLGILASNWSVQTGLSWVDADFTGDGAIDVGDLGVLAGHWGETQATTLSTGSDGGGLADDPSAVPEPLVTVGVVLGGGLLLRRRRYRRPRP
jgi:hypothetical protein